MAGNNTGALPDLNLHAHYIKLTAEKEIKFKKLSSQNSKDTSKGHFEVTGANVNYIKHQTHLNIKKCCLVLINYLSTITLILIEFAQNPNLMNRDLSGNLLCKLTECKKCYHLICAHSIIKQQIGQHKIRLCMKRLQLIQTRLKQAQLESNIAEFNIDLESKLNSVAEEISKIIKEITAERVNSSDTTDSESSEFVYKCQCENTNDCQCFMRTDCRTYPTIKSIHDWSNQNVVDWLTAVKFHPYTDHFLSRNIKGSDLIQLDNNKLAALGVKSKSHQDLLLAAITDLIHSEQMPFFGFSYNDVEQIFCPTGNVEDELSDVNIHQLLNDHQHQLSSMTVGAITICAKCEQNLHGLYNQGLICLKCFLIYHRTCAVNGLPQCGIEPTQISSRIDTFISKSLEQEILYDDDMKLANQDTEFTAPRRIRICCEKLERIVEKDTQIDGYKVYQSSLPSGIDLEQLKQFVMLLDDNELQLTTENNAQIASYFIKDYLYKLNDSVIPARFYQRFITIIANETETSSHDLIQLCEELPKNHLKTLKYLIRHFRRLCILQCNKNIREPPISLIRSISRCILHPPWTQYIEIVENTKYHDRLIELLMHSTEWFSDKLPEFQTAPAIPPRKLSKFGSMCLMTPTPHVLSPLAEVEWYWGSITREDVCERLANKPDGTFLVRDGSANPNEFVLTLVKDGQVKLIKIFEERGYYGFTAPYLYESVIDLVNYYRKHSLKAYNTMLDTCLLFPVSRFQQSAILDDYQEDNNQYVCPQPTHNLEEVISQFCRKWQITKEKEELFNGYEEHFEKISIDLANKEETLIGFDETILMFELQLKLLKQICDDVASNTFIEMNILQDNKTILDERLKLLITGRKQLDAEVKELKQNSGEYQFLINSLREDLISIEQQLNKMKRTLCNAGMSESQIQQLQEIGIDAWEMIKAGNKKWSDDRLWLLPTFTRHLAEKLLTLSQENGMFLIRRSSSGSQENFALSIQCAGIIYHCIIYNTVRGYGFAEPFNIYENLGDLVQHYAENTLQEHNERLATTLVTPIGQFVIKEWSNIKNKFDAEEINLIKKQFNM